MPRCGKPGTEPAEADREPEDTQARVDSEASQTELAAIQSRQMLDRGSEDRHGSHDHQYRADASPQSVPNAAVEKRPASETIGGTHQFHDLDFGTAVQNIEP